MADYRCNNCGGYPGHNEDCSGVLKNTCAACEHSLHSKYMRGKKSIICGNHGCTCADSEKSEWDKLNEEVIWV